jgi:hypothetical protein
LAKIIACIRHMLPNATDIVPGLADYLIADRVLAAGFTRQGSSGGGAILCNCGEPASKLVRMHNLPADREPQPICEACAAHHEAMAQDTNDHEMRNFGGAYGLVSWTYLPLPESATIAALRARAEAADAARVEAEKERQPIGDDEIDTMWSRLEMAERVDLPAETARSIIRRIDAEHSRAEAARTLADVQHQRALAAEAKLAESSKARRYWEDQAHKFGAAWEGCRHTLRQIGNVGPDDQGDCPRCHQHIAIARAALPHLIAPGGALVPRELLIEAAEYVTANRGYKGDYLWDKHDDADLARRLRSAAGAAGAAGE